MSTYLDVTDIFQVVKQLFRPVQTNFCNERNGLFSKSSRCKKSKLNNESDVYPLGWHVGPSSESRRSLERPAASAARLPETIVYTPHSAHSVPVSKREQLQRRDRQNNGTGLTSLLYSMCPEFKSSMEFHKSLFATPRKWSRFKAFIMSYNSGSYKKRHFRHRHYKWRLVGSPPSRTQATSSHRDEAVSHSPNMFLINDMECAAQCLSGLHTRPLSLSRWHTDPA